MTGTSDDEEGKWKNRSTTLRRLGRQYSPDVTPEVASRRLKQWIVGNPVLLGLLHENGWTASRRVLTPKLKSILKCLSRKRTSAAPLTRFQFDTCHLPS